MKQLRDEAPNRPGLPSYDAMMRFRGEMTTAGEEMSVKELKAELRALEAEMDGVVTKKDLVKLYCETWETENFALWSMSKAELTERLTARGIDATGWDKAKLVEENTTFRRDVYKGAANCYNCPACKQRRRDWKTKLKERRRANCEHCGARAMKLCSDCGLSSFCGPKCFRASWPAHKKICKHRQARDTAVRNLLGLSKDDDEFGVHTWNYITKENTLFSASFDFYQGTAISIETAEYDDYTRDFAVMHFINKRTEDDQFLILHLGKGNWIPLSLDDAIRDPMWPFTVHDDLIQRGIIPQMNRDPSHMGIHTCLVGGLREVHHIVALDHCNMESCSCIFKRLNKTRPHPAQFNPSHIMPL